MRSFLLRFGFLFLFIQQIIQFVSSITLHHEAKKNKREKNGEKSLSTCRLNSIKEKRENICSSVNTRSLVESYKNHEIFLFTRGAACCDFEMNEEESGENVKGSDCD